MKTKQVEIEGRKFIISELKYKEMTSFSDLEKNEAAKQIMLISTKMTSEEYDELSVKEGIAIQKEINELNGLNDFQQPPTN